MANVYVQRDEIYKNIKWGDDCLLAGSFKYDAWAIPRKIDLLKLIYEVFLSNLSLITRQDEPAAALSPSLGCFNDTKKQQKQQRV